MKSTLRAALAIVPFFAIEFSREISSGVLQRISPLPLPQLSEPLILAALGIGMLVAAQSARRTLDRGL